MVRRYGLLVVGLALALLGLLVIAEANGAAQAAQLFAPNGQAKGKAGPAPAASCDGAGWTIVASPNRDTGSLLTAVANRAANDAWAVGSYSDSLNRNEPKPLIEHWDGSSWQISANVSLTVTTGELYGVVAVGANDAWAVGRGKVNDNDPIGVLILHWNGTNWRQVPTPPINGAGSELRAVAAGGGEVWAVGSYIYSQRGYSADENLILHWNGTAWSQVRAPGFDHEKLYGVAWVSATDAWAVGASDTFEHSHLRWDGTTWNRVATSQGAANTLYAVTALSNGQVWAVGSYMANDPSSGTVERTMSLRWNGTQWQGVVAVSPSASSTQFDGVAGTDAANVWGVGFEAENGARQAMIQHWDGAAWRLDSAASPGGTSSELLGAAALSSGDVWAVGSRFDSSGGHTLIERYRLNCGVPSSTPTATPATDCTASWADAALPGAAEQQELFGSTVAPGGTTWLVGERLDVTTGITNPLVLRDSGGSWQEVSPPGLGKNASLHAISAAAADDVWAAGEYIEHGIAQTLIEHWNGASWTIAPSPNSGPGAGYLYAIEALSPTDVWASGFVCCYQGAFLLHWNGTAWSIVPGPTATDSEAQVYGISAIASNDVWAVGSYDNASRLWISHWDGSQWHALAGPAGGGLYAVAALADNDVWAVGYTFSAPATKAALIIHWNGNAWSVVGTPVSSAVSSLRALAAVSAMDIWAVGEQMPQSYSAAQALALHLSNGQWKLEQPPLAADGLSSLISVAAVGPSGGYVVGRAVLRGELHPYVEHYTVACGGIQPTSTPRATPTIGPGCLFSDVCPSDYFFTPVSYLVEQGAISGYGDNTFRPFNTATRGQVTKIVVSATGYQINTSGAPHFSDVPVTNPFFSFIETAYNAHLISGYADGTFQWSGNITRGQLSKIVVAAFRWTADSSGGPHFNDVARDNPFYSAIETAFHHHALSGYDDGSFRWGNNATRGQIAKIVYQAGANP